MVFLPSFFLGYLTKTAYRTIAEVENETNRKKYYNMYMSGAKPRATTDKEQHHYGDGERKLFISLLKIYRILPWCLFAYAYTSSGSTSLACGIFAMKQNDRQQSRDTNSTQPLKKTQQQQTTQNAVNASTVTTPTHTHTRTKMNERRESGANTTKTLPKFVYC